MVRGSGADRSASARTRAAGSRHGTRPCLACMSVNQFTAVTNAIHCRRQGSRAATATAMSMGLYEIYQKLRNPPFWLYEILPLVYAGGGIACIFFLDHWVRSVSSSLLIVAAIQVLCMRRGRRFASKPRASDGEAALVGMSWLSHYSVDHQDLDGEHRAISELGQAILHALVDGEFRRMDELLDEIVVAIEEHVRNEERVLLDDGSPHAQAHLRTHRRLLGAYKRGRSRATPCCITCSTACSRAIRW